MRYLAIIIIYMLLFSTAGATDAPWQFTPNDVSGLHNKPADFTLSYGKDPLQFGELRLPQGKGPFPVAIVIHGGCWVAQFADLKNSAALADALRSMGIATWNIEYRRIDNPGGGWPGTFQDAAQAADYLKTIASRYSLDLNHVITIGHSAGGHLALWLAARHKLSSDSVLYSKDPLKIHGVISLGGVPNLPAFRRQAIKVCDADVVGKLVGNVVLRYKQVSPNALLPLNVPQILIYGANEQVVPINFGYDYQREAHKHHENVEVVVVKYAAHHEYNAPNSVTWPAIRDAVESLILS